MDESDGIEEALEGQMRVVVTAAGQAGEQLARLREQRLTEARRRSEQEGRDYSARLQVERAAARAQLAPVSRSEWWDRATPEQIAQTYEAAVSWAQSDPEAARAEQRIVEELRTRHGIAPEELRSQVAQERAARAAEPVFSVSEFRNEQDMSRRISKAEALATIERTPGDAELSIGGRGGLDDIKSWKGRDPDVDRAIAQKFPQLEESAARDRAPAGAEQERRAANHDLVEAQLLMTQADRLDRAASVGREGADDGFADRENEIRLAAAQDAQRDYEVTGRHFASDEERDSFYEREPELAAARAAATRDAELSAYDTAERREAFASELERSGVDRETAATWMRADVSQGKPATEATRSATAKAPRARKGHGARGQEAQRGGLER